MALCHHWKTQHSYSETEQVWREKARLRGLPEEEKTVSNRQTCVEEDKPDCKTKKGNCEKKDRQKQMQDIKTGGEKLHMRR